MPFKDPEKMKMYMRERRAKEKAQRKVNKNTVNPKRKPVNPIQTHKLQNTVNTVNKNNSCKPVNLQEYLLSYSRNKYQFVLYEINKEGQKTLVKSYPKGSVLYFHESKVRLTWGPEVEA